MTRFLTSAARLLFFRGPVSDTRRYCANEFSRASRKARHQLRAEYAELFAAELQGASSELLKTP